MIVKRIEKTPVTNEELNEYKDEITGYIKHVSWKSDNSNFKNAEIEVAINAFLINEELDSISKNHYTANLISNYSNKSMSQYSSAFLEIYCDSIARIRSKPVSRFEFEELYNQSVD